nr:MAG: hypothetical protein [Bacteriophage sp.]
MTIINKLSKDSYDVEMFMDFLSGEDLYNLETLKVVDARLKRVQEDQEKISKRKQEVYDMLKLSNEKLLYEYATNNVFFESRLLKEEILKRMS